MRRSLDIGRFRGFDIGNNNVLSHLQYADDTVFLGEASYENLWAIKSVLRGFELASGLKVNFNKSCMFGVNVETDFMVNASNFLFCKIGSLPFNYLGLPGGSNPRKLSTWQPVIRSLRRRLLNWKGRKISFGGRIILLNSVLTSLPLYYISLFGVPKQVQKIIIGIQRTFLWGGGAEKKKIAWVKWSNVCKPKDLGGLGVKNLNLFNLSLLGKWKWRFLEDKQAIWYNILNYRYGLSNMGPAGISWQPSKSSIWWRDLNAVDNIRSGLPNWFGNGVIKKLGNGATLDFWQDVWLGTSNFKSYFPSLYLISLNKTAKVSEMGSWADNNWEWNLRWRRPLFVWEESEMGELKGMLAAAMIICNMEDKWVWKASIDKSYNVKSAYSLLLSIGSVGNSELVPKSIWKTNMPNKVLAFSWLLLLDRLPTRLNLFHRNVILDLSEAECALCGEELESANHLFYNCKFSSQVWSFLYSWFNLPAVLPIDAMEHYEYHRGLVTGKVLEKNWLMLWHTVVWSLWLARNNIIFEEGTLDLLNIIDMIKVRSWTWVQARNNVNQLSFSDWCCAPLQCLKNIS